MAEGRERVAISREDAERQIAEALARSYAAGRRDEKEKKALDRSAVLAACVSTAEELFDLVQTVPRSLLQIGLDAAVSLSGVQQRVEQLQERGADLLFGATSPRKGKR